jgi:hypothetical protein
VPLENWHSGGLSVGIDLDSGRLGRACTFPQRSDGLAWYSTHPETGARIDGAMVPDWQGIRERMVGLVERIGYLRYVGWDIAITADGFRILEGNNAPGVKVVQVHRPLLADPRARAFYRRHAVVRGRNGE